MEERIRVEVELGCSLCGEAEVTLVKGIWVCNASAVIFDPRNQEHHSESKVDICGNALAI